jgi:hypothetical protein
MISTQPWPYLAKLFVRIAEALRFDHVLGLANATAYSGLVSTSQS